MMEKARFETLTPAQATRIVRNGGLVWYAQTCVLLGWHDGANFKTYRPSNRTIGTDCEGWDSYRYPTYTHPAYPPSVFAREYPCTLPGPEAKALLMKAPVWMLEYDFLRWGVPKHWDGKCFRYRDGSQVTNIHEYHEWEIRIRPGWLESQRARFARGEFGEAVEPWRTATLATGYVWDGKQAAEALRAGMEAKQVHWADDDLVRSVGEKIVNTRGCVCWEKYPHEEYLKSYTANNWALRWPAKETNMETKEETLTGWDLLKCIKEGEVWEEDGNADIHHYRRVGEELEYNYNDEEWEDVRGLDLWDFLTATFTRVPAKPTSKTITLESGMVVTVFADRVEADVPGCGKWTSTKRKYEVALKLEGLVSEMVMDFADKAGKKYHGTIYQTGVIVERKEITFSDIRRVLDAMGEVEG